MKWKKPALDSVICKPLRVLLNRSKELWGKSLPVLNKYWLLISITIAVAGVCVCVLLFASDIKASTIGTVVGAIGSILTALAAIWVAFTAKYGLNTWKHQIRTQMHIQFMDELNDTVHEYIQAMEAPIQSFGFIKMSIDCHSEVEQLKQNNTENSGIIAYIEKNGKSDQVRLNQYLDKVRPIMSRMMSLATKGQVLGFDKYTECYRACEILAWSFKQIEWFAGMIGNVNLNWQNPKVQQALDKIMTVNEESIRTNIRDQNVILLEFIKQNYQTLLT